MSFVLMQHGKPVGMAATLADIVAAAQTHRITLPERSASAGEVLRGQDGTPDPVHILAHVVAPPHGDMIEVASLAGSFNPLIAQQMMVGKRR
ncbi:hypothetical protein [Sphingobium subterraneum]|uniref:Uncharacterized protein n=1 Tax=Sphingobium subterraneum TaxID=627688 RepID=A0A841J7L1_9SPHN|nr:hypothetical protein [Sphingobium subterraneum]MBB6124515.1 hypothetical protein [Sphingobium subterraneum]